MNAKRVAHWLFNATQTVCLWAASARISLIIIMPIDAQASAWLVPVGEIKLSVSQDQHDLTYRQALPGDTGDTGDTGAAFVTRKARQRDQQIYLEYGYRQKLSFVGKAFDSRLKSDQSSVNGSLFELGARVDAAHLRTGLLPPFVYDLLQLACPNCRLSREKRTSLEINAIQTSHNRRPKTREFSASISLADRLFMQPYTMAQQIRFTYGGAKLKAWQNWEYRFQLGYQSQYFIGQESQAYVDQTSAFAKLAHSVFVE
jgi:hypothetical protein